MVDVVCGIMHRWFFKKDPLVRQVNKPFVNGWRHQGKDYAGWQCLGPLAKANESIPSDLIDATRTLIEHQRQAQHFFVEASCGWQISSIEKGDLLVNGWVGHSQEQGRRVQVANNSSDLQPVPNQFDPTNSLAAIAAPTMPASFSN